MQNLGKPMKRRDFLRAAVVGAGAVAFSFSVTRVALAWPAQTGPSPYGSLQSPDANGIELPEGFTSRVIARSTETVTGTSHAWHSAPDGGACFADGTGWIYVSNSELSSGSGGVGAVRFDSSGQITDAYAILSGTNRNCSGGATPWNTWLSCEEVDRGFVYETDPWGANPDVRRDAMGRFKHEAAAANPDREVVYLTEDEPDGCFYRFEPDTWGDLSSGVLEVAVIEPVGSDNVVWKTIPDPSGSSTRTRYQVSDAEVFKGGEGAYYSNGFCYFTTKGDDRVWAYNENDNTVSIVYDDDLTDNPPLTGVDNITTDRHVGDLYVAEDGGNMEIGIITPDDIVAPFLRVTGQSSSELCGVAFNPDGDRMYFSSQRGTSGTSSGGITYEISGPFRVSAGLPLPHTYSAGFEQPTYSVGNLASQDGWVNNSSGTDHQVVVPSGGEPAAPGAQVARLTRATGSARAAHELSSAGTLTSLFTVDVLLAYADVSADGAFAGVYVNDTSALGGGGGNSNGVVFGYVDGANVVGGTAGDVHIAYRDGDDYHSLGQAAENVFHRFVVDVDPATASYDIVVEDLGGTPVGSVQDAASRAGEDQFLVIQLAVGSGSNATLYADQVALHTGATAAEGRR